MTTLPRTVPLLLLSLVFGCGGADFGEGDTDGGGGGSIQDGAIRQRDSAGVDARHHDAGDVGTTQRSDSSQTDSGAPEATLPDSATTASMDGGDDASHDAARDARDASDAAAPTIVATDPVSGATAVSIAKSLSATFSEAMSPTSLTAATFSLREGTQSVAGTVTYVASDTRASFVPAHALDVGTAYTATLTTGARSTDGVALAHDYTWTFTTSACGQAAVDLRSAASFAVLAGSTVTSDGPTSVTGDLGVSPGTSVTGFPPGTVSAGSIEAGNSVAAQAATDLATAYDDAAGRTLCATGVAGDLGGQTLTPGLYASTSALSITSGNLTLDAKGDPNAVFLIQTATTLNVATGLRVVLAGGASSAKVFWQVGTSATLGAAAVFEGTLLASQSVSLGTGATVHGRVMAVNAAVTLLSNTVVKPG